MAIQVAILGYVAIQIAININSYSNVNGLLYHVCDISALEIVKFQFFNV